MDYNLRRPVKVYGDVEVVGDLAVAGNQVFTGDVEVKSTSKFAVKITDPEVSGDVIHNAHILRETWRNLGATGLSYLYDITSLITGTGTNVVTNGTNVLTTSGTSSDAEGTQLQGEPITLGEKLTRMEYDAITLSSAAAISILAGFFTTGKYARLRFDATGDTNFMIEVDDGSGAQVIDTGVAADTAAHTFSVEIDSSGKITSIVFDTVEQTLTAAILALTFTGTYSVYHFVKTLAAATKALTVGPFTLYYSK